HVFGLLTGRRPLITKDTARITRNSYFYSSKKVTDAAGIIFRPLEDTVSWCCSQLLEQSNQGQVSAVS
ncbi:MAG: hypothetical protein LPJ89_04525, partial [Hymenobacteraceae bacterium]|nr:hypothetical protein [Hymenobacteraceae bacterium]MDX5395544.1 hypothetical protein [Hymenobacteraceae bacterium]MDX5443031.1 hypothetical protein [Hymenobacteraceae bacterium]MDX5511598.1 hypothetical protein [Hymenobacteraceae bacterium]